MKTSASSGSPGEPGPTALEKCVSKTPDTALDQAGVAEHSVQSDTIGLRQLTGVTLLCIHSLQPADALNAALAAHDLALPAKVNHSLGQDPVALCLAPREWWLFSEFLSFDRLAQSILPAIDSQLTAVLDFSAAAAVFRISGSGAPHLLNKLSGLDFHSGTAGGAHCARTRLQHAAATLHYHRPGGQAHEFVFDLIIDRSLALYAWQLLTASIPHAEELTRMNRNTSR